MRSFSTPARTSTAKTMSSAWTARNNAPSDARGAKRFAASETP
jgi:hypothetical protein